MSRSSPAENHPPADRAAADGVTDASCGNCGRSVDVGEPGKVVCVAHLEFRRLDEGSNCHHYLPRKPAPMPPQLDAEARGDDSLDAPRGEANTAAATGD